MSTRGTTLQMTGLVGIIYQTGNDITRTSSPVVGSVLLYTHWHLFIAQIIAPTELDPDRGSGGSRGRGLSKHGLETCTSGWPPLVVMPQSLYENKTKNLQLLGWSLRLHSGEMAMPLWLHISHIMFTGLSSDWRSRPSWTTSALQASGSVNEYNKCWCKEIQASDLRFRCGLQVIN